MDRAEQLTAPMPMLSKLPGGQAPLLGNAKARGCGCERPSLHCGCVGAVPRCISLTLVPPLLLPLDLHCCRCCCHHGPCCRWRQCWASSARAMRACRRCRPRWPSAEAGVWTGTAAWMFMYENRLSSRYIYNSSAKHDMIRMRCNRRAEQAIGQTADMHMDSGLRREP